MTEKMKRKLDAELDKLGICYPSKVPTIQRRFLASDGLYYNGYPCSPDFKPRHFLVSPIKLRLKLFCYHLEAMILWEKLKKLISGLLH